MSQDSVEPTAASNPFESVKAGGPVARQRRGPAASPDTLAPLEAPQPTVPLPSPYEFVSVLGRGGMGVVYQARDTRDGRHVAIKFLNASGSDAQLNKRFQREASELARLDHPNIVSFFEHGYFQKQTYMVMEFIEGGSLRALLALQDGPLTVQQTLELFAGVADGLEYIHRHELVHRDLKPDNILLTRDRQPKIGDFGLALNTQEDRSRITQSGMILGTYSYLSPEQILSRDIGPAADLYALGCCMYEAVTGRPLFSAETEFALLNSHLRQTPVPPREIRVDIPADLDLLILQLLSKQPGERPDSAATVARALRRMLQSQKQVWSLPLIGREKQLHELEQYLRPCLLRQPVGVLLTAPSGQGRSSVVRQLVSNLQKASIAVHLLVPLPYNKEPAAQLYTQLGGSPELWQQSLAQGGPEGAAALLWKQLESLGAPRLVIIDDMLRQPATTNRVVEAFCAYSPPAGFGWLISAALSRANQLRIWERAHRVELAPLDDQALRDVAQLQLSGHLDDELSEGLLFRAQGSVRRLRLWILALRGAGLLQRQGQMLSRDHGQAWPDELWDPLWRQIGSRPEAELKLLRIAGLLEEPFAYPLVQQLSELEEAETNAALDVLLRDGLLEECWGQPGDLFQFCGHELKQKLIESSTDRLKRRVYGRAAQTLENVAPLGVLASYLKRAGMEAEALPKYLQAAFDAEQTADYSQAEQLWQEALQIAGEDTAPEMRLMALAGRCANLLRLLRLAEIEVAAADELARPQPDSAELKKTRRQLAGIVARARWLRGERGLELVEFCRGELGQLADSDFSDSLWLTWCWAAYCLEEGDPGRGLEILSRLPGESYPAPYHWLRAALLRTQGQAAEADRELRQFLDSGAPRTTTEEVEILLELAQVQVQLGHSPDETGRWLDQATARAHQLGDVALLAEIEWHRGLLHEAQHDLGAALRSHNRVVEAARPGSPWLTQGHLQKGIVLCKLGRLEEAEDTLNTGLQNAPTTPADLLLALGGLAILRHDWNAALEAFASAEKQSAGVTARLMRAWCLWHLDQSEVAGNLLDGLETPADPLEKWLKQRVLKLQHEAPEPWPQPDERPWILQHHPLRAILGRLTPLRRPSPGAPAVPEPVAPSGSSKTRPREAPPASPNRNWGWVAVLVVAAGLGLLLRPLLWEGLPGAASPSATPTASAVASDPVATATPTSVPFVPPAEGTLALRVKPAKAQVRLDGRLLPLTGGKLQRKLPPGAYHLEVRAEGYENEERELSIGESERVEREITLTPVLGGLQISTVPVGSQVWVDGALLGKSLSGKGGKVLAKEKLKPGRHTVKAAHRGYASKTTTTEVVAGETRKVSIELVELPPEPVYVAPPPAPYVPYDPGPAPYVPPPPAPYVPPPAPGPAAPDSF